MTNEEPAVSIRKPVPWVRLSGVALLVLVTLVGAAANMMPFHVPTKHEMRRADQLAVVAARRARIIAQLAAGDRCDVDIARELARDIVFEGLSAAPYADDYATRCFDDAIVRRWANVGITLRLPQVPLAAVPLIAART